MDRFPKRAIAYATALLAVLYGLALLVLLGHHFETQAWLTVRYATILACMSIVSAIVVRDSSQKLTDAPEPIPHRNAIFGGFCVYLVGCAVLATYLDGERNLLASVHPMLYWLIYNGAIRFLVGAVIPIFILRRLGFTNEFFAIGVPNKNNLPLGILWIAVVACFIIFDVKSGTISLPDDLMEIVRNAFRAGVSEEFLFRGALLGFLQKRLPFGYANLLQALAFGAWHYGIDGQYSGHVAIVTISLMVCVHAVFGYGLGFVRRWTNSITVPIAFHAIADATEMV